MFKKLTLIISLSLIVFLTFTSNSNQAIAACASRAAIPIETNVKGGGVTITLRWDLIANDKFDASWSDRPPLFITIFNPEGERVGGAIAVEVPGTRESMFVQTSGFNPGTLYRIHVTDSQELDANPPITGACTYEVDDPAPTFSVTTSEQPPLKIGDDCELSRLKCPTGTYCAYKNMDTTKHRICLKPPTSGEACIPEAQGNINTGLQCVNNSSCKKKGDKFICTNNKLNPINTPCGTSLSGDDSNAIKKTETKDDEGWECLNISSALGIRIYTDPFKLIPQLIEAILGVAGAIVIILIIRSGYKLMFSQGNPEKTQEAREELTSAIVGLLFIVFSFVLLQFILNDLLRIQDLPKGSSIK